MWASATSIFVSSIVGRSASGSSMALGACEEVSRAGDQGSPDGAGGQQNWGLCTGAAGSFPRLHCQRRQYAGLSHIQFHGLSQKYRSLGPDQEILLASAQW